MKHIVVVHFLIISAFRTGHGQTTNCGKRQFQCKDGYCIPGIMLCDGQQDCRDKSDETVEECSTKRHISCPDFGFRCAYGACVDVNRTCNGVRDCADNSDETLPKCNRSNNLSSESRRIDIKCNNGQCISVNNLHDGYKDCISGLVRDPVLCLMIRSPTDYTEPSAIPMLTNTDTPYVPSVTCRTPPKPRNGDWKVHKSQCESGEHCHVGQDFQFQIGTYLVYSCNRGFKVKGFPEVLCGINGVWDNIPECEEVHCPNPNSVLIVAECIDPETGSISCDSPKPGTIATLKCRNSYSEDRTLTTYTNVTCYGNGEWTLHTRRRIPGPPVIPLTTPTIPCYVPSVTCRTPPQPQNGDWKVHKSQCLSGQHCHVGQDIPVPMGTHLVYSCNRGVKIKGFTDVFCSTDGVWYNIPECEEVRCTNLNSASIVAECIDPETDSISCDSPKPGTIATLKCRNSYSEDRTLTTYTNVTCYGNGEWTPQPLRCIPEPSAIPMLKNTLTPYVPSVTCRTPPRPRNGDWKVHISQCESGEHCHVRQDFQFQIGTHLVYSCNRGFKVKGLTDVFCGINGIWYEIPECEEVRCANLNSASIVADCKYHGSDFISCDSSRPGTIATLECRNSYREDRTLPSPTSVRCNDNGEWTPEPLRCVPVCGIIPTETTPLIVNGTPANIIELPWHATLYRVVTPTARKEFICGGTIIHEKLIITAAHCIYDESNRRKRDASNFFVATGTQYRDYDSPFHNNVTLVRTAVKKIYVSCDYNGIFGNYKADIAILEVATPFVFSTLLQPICLDYTNSIELEPDMFGRVAGFGRTALGPSSYLLQTIKVPYISNRKCNEESNIHETENYITYDKFCAGYKNGSSVCDGDSGGGLIFEWGKLWYLKGIVSVSLGTKVVGGTMQCDSSTYSLYTAVSFHMKWIQDFILGVDDIQRFHTSC